MPIIQATEAKRAFGSVLKGVARGETYTVVRHNEPVARIVPLHYESPTDPFGALRAYADPKAHELEEGAFARAMEAKHGSR